MVENKRQLEKLLAYECRDATYSASYPLVLDSGKGSEVFDVEGRRYIDLCGGFGVHGFGHNPKILYDLFNEQLRGEKIIHGMGDLYPSRDKVVAAEALAQSLPKGMQRVSFALSGSHAVEIALKTAMLKTKKAGFIAIKDGYHGLDMGVLPVTSRQDFSVDFADYIRRDNVQYVERCFERRDLEAASQRLKDQGLGLAGMIVEPVSGRGGMRELGVDRLGLAAQFCKGEGALLIYDEVFCGLGRTGPWTYAELVQPDLTCFGKLLGLGFPVSACCGSDEAFSGWPDEPEAIHTGTFFGHPFSMRCAKAYIDEWHAGDWRAKTKQKSVQFLKLLDAAFGRKAGVREVRGFGMWFGIEFEKPGRAGELLDVLSRAGVLTLPSGPRGEVLSLVPAFNMEATLFEQAAEIIDSCLS